MAGNGRKEAVRIVKAALDSQPGRELMAMLRRDVLAPLSCVAIAGDGRPSALRYEDALLVEGQKLLVLKLEDMLNEVIEDE